MRCLPVGMRNRQLRPLDNACGGGCHRQPAHTYPGLIGADDVHREMVARPAKRSDMVEALDAIENGMTRVAMSRDIWQNDLIYALCQGVRLLLEERVKK